MSEFTGGKYYRVMPKPMPFPEKGETEVAVLKKLMHKIAENIETEKNFSLSYAGPAHPFAKKAYALGTDALFVSGWGDRLFAGTIAMEREAVRMVSSLLHLSAERSVGFINSGGTESNILAVRMAKLLGGKSKPEILLPLTGHFSFSLAGHLLGVRVRRAPIDEELNPNMDKLEKMINKNTVALVCSAPEPALGVMDPVEEFAELAQKHGLYLHVDAAFGGFILPFMTELGYKVPRFDFSLPSVSSMMTDGHKLGLLPIAASFLLFRDRSFLEKIPSETLRVQTITSTKNGGLATAAWALFQHLGKEGYKKYVQNVLEVTRTISNGIEEMDGVRLVRKPFITLIGFTTERVRLARVHDELLKRGWGIMMEEIPGKREGFIRLSVGPMRTKEYALGFLQAIRESVKAAS